MPTPPKRPGKRRSLTNLPKNAEALKVGRRKPRVGIVWKSAKTRKTFLKERRAKYGSYDHKPGDLMRALEEGIHTGNIRRSVGLEKYAKKVYILNPKTKRWVIDLRREARQVYAIPGVKPAILRGGKGRVKKYAHASRKQDEKEI